MAHYENMLYTALINQLTPKEVLVSANHSKRHAEELLKRAVEKKHIKTNDIVIRENGHIMKETICSLTNEGLRYLIASNKKNGEQMWVNNISAENTFGAGLFGENKSRQRTTTKMAMTSEARTMTELAGGISPLLINNRQYVIDAEEKSANCENDSDVTEDMSYLEWSDFECSSKIAAEKYTYTELIKAGLKESGKEYLLSFPAYDKMSPRFVPQTMVKEAFMEAAGYDEKDYFRCKFTGIIETTKKAYLTYSTYQMAVQWNRWIVRTEIQLYHKWLLTHSICKRPKDFNEVYGILFIKNKRHLKTIIERSKEQTVGYVQIGEGLKQLCAVPKTYEGTQYLNWLLNIDQREDKLKIIELCEQNGFMQLPTNSVFELIDGSGKRYAIGNILDVIQIQNMKREILKGPSGSYGIICFAWQEEYYRALFSEITTIAIG